MSQNLQNIKDFEFIAEKLEFFLLHAKDDHKKISEYLSNNKSDVFYKIPNPFRRGDVIIGREAQSRFFAIAKRYCQNIADDKLNVDLLEFVRELKNEFSERFIKAGLPIEEKYVSRCISAAYKNLTISYVERTHFIPCEFFYKPAQDIFDIGAVRFYTIKKFNEVFKDKLIESRDATAKEHQRIVMQAVKEWLPKERACTPEHSKEHANFLYDGAITFFNNYKWVAKVTIPKCSENESTKRALLSAKTALNIAKLILGESYSDRIGTAYCKRKSDKHAKIYMDESDLFHFSRGWSSNQNHLGKNWERVFKEKADYIFNVCKSTLDRIIAPTQKRDLKNRFVDALFWYGEAVTEDFLAAKFIKYMTAIERMTVTSKDDVTSQVVNRSSVLCCILNGGVLDEWKEKVSRLYDLRSRMVHGDVSPLNKELKKWANKAEKISRSTLLQGLDYFEYLGSDDEISNKKLDQGYKQLVDNFELKI